MNPSPTPSQPAGLDLSDIYFVLFRHKWKILLCSLAGFAAAAAMYRNEAPPYQSEAKLLVRYIVTESKSGAPNSGGTSKILPDERGASIMNTEVEILTSLDLARDVAQSIGPERIMAKLGGGKDLGAATNYVKSNLSANSGQGSSVLHVVFKHPDPELVQPVLRAVIDRYYKMHVEAHHAAGIVGDSLASEADTLRARLAETEDALRKATKAAGVVSLTAAKETLANQINATRREVFNYEADLASQIAVFEDLKRRVPATDTKTAESAESEVPFEVIEDFQRIAARIQRLQLREQDLLAQFQPETEVVKMAKMQRIEAETELRKLRTKYPKLTRAAVPGENAKVFDSEANQLAATWTQITGYQAKIKELNSQLDRLRAEAAKLEQMEGTILELTRTKELQEANYRYYAAQLEQSRISETVGSGKVSNITQIQTPSAAFRDRINTKKIGVVAVSGVIVGLGWAFLLELFLDRSVRRPVDLQRMLQSPLLLSIPQLKASARLPNRRQLALTNGSSAADAVLEDTDASANGTLPTLAAFHDTLRDRLVSFFESRNLTHKPKLVTVTSLRTNAGVTTTATGLARSLSETGEGNVLLVDMTTSQGSAQEFSKGKKTIGLEELLEGRAEAHVHENLYVVSELNNSERLSRNLPQRFNKLIPKLKASDFDYIIFDMPPVNQLSITPRLANFMDMVLLVVESEKTDRDLVQGACEMLAESKAHVGLVLNKTRNYVPSRLQQQLAHQ